METIREDHPVLELTGLVGGFFHGENLEDWVTMNALSLEHGGEAALGDPGDILLRGHTGGTLSIGEGGGGRRRLVLDFK